MPYNPNLHNRRSIRLQSYDYAQSGAYFITISTNKKVDLFGGITAGAVLLSVAGKIARVQWQEIPQHFNHVVLGEFVVMPNHMHAIVVIRNGNESQEFRTKPIPHPAGTASGSVSAIVQNYKSVTTRKINKELGRPGVSIWQRNYYEHIIRDEEEFARIVDYIKSNPERWENGGL